MKISIKKSSKGSDYIGVYKCSKTKLYYSKNYRNKRCYKSALFKKEIDAAHKYDAFILKHDPCSKKINFPIFAPKNKISIKNLKNRIFLLNKKDITKRSKSGMCETCQKKSLRIVERPPYDVLINEVDQHGYVQVGKKYGVSDNSIRKWLNCLLGIENNYELLLAVRNTRVKTLPQGNSRSIPSELIQKIFLPRRLLL